MLEKVKQFVKESYEKSATGRSVDHFEETLNWVKKLKPDADEPMLIAAYAHDIARGFRKTNTQDTFKDKEFNDPEILREHQDEGARIISEFLRENGYNEENIKRVANMVGHHEEGGDEESDLIKDADSLSYFDTNAIKHAGLIEKLGKDRVKNKIKWMFDRISSPEAKELAMPNYEKVMEMLDSA